MDIENLATWGNPVEVKTKLGVRVLRKARPTESFWSAWRSEKEALRLAGISCSKSDRTGDWEICWWQPISQETQAAREEARAASRATDAAIEIPEKIINKLLPYQIPAVRQQLAAIINGGALDASDTGTGKTYVNLAVCAVLDRPVFVVSPKPVIPSWHRAAQHLGVKIDICNYELLRRGEQPAVGKSKGARGQDIFTWQLPKETIIIMDECHRAKDGKTQNNKMCTAALRQSYIVLGLSATAADNPMQMKFSGLLTGLFENEKGFWPWTLRHGVSQGRWGYEFNGNKKILARIHAEIFPSRGVRVRIADLGDAFPETQIAAETYQINGATKEINRIYAEMAAELKRLAMKEYEDGDPIPLTIRLRARQRIELLKIPAIAEMVEDGVESGMSVVVFLNFNESVDSLCARLKTNCVIRGGQSDAEREKNIAAFQADKEPVIIANIKAGSIGISLHGSPQARTRLAIICPTDSGQDLKQALGRVYRAQGAKSLQRIFFAAGTVEEKVCANVNTKIARIDALNDGIGTLTDSDLEIKLDENGTELF